jgi:hypothetical protein
MSKPQKKFYFLNEKFGKDHILLWLDNDKVGKSLIDETGGCYMFKGLNEHDQTNNLQNDNSGDRNEGFIFEGLTSRSI